MKNPSNRSGVGDEILYMIPDYIIIQTSSISILKTLAFSPRLNNAKDIAWIIQARCFARRSCVIFMYGNCALETNHEYQTP